MVNKAERSQDHSHAVHNQRPHEILRDDSIATSRYSQRLHEFWRIFWTLRIAHAGTSFTVFGAGRTSTLDRVHALAVLLQPENRETHQQIEFQEVFFSWYEASIHVFVHSNAFSSLVSL